MVLPSNSNCKSINLIYAIHCLKCNKSYIGQTGRSAEARISEHINKIIKYKKNKNILENENIDSLILYNHFKNDDHEIKEHFRFQVLCKDILNYRIRLETDLMYIFNTIFPNGLNNLTLDFNNNFETYNFNY